MPPNELFKRRHYGTPQSVLLIITNFIVFGAATSIFVSPKSVYWFYWVVIGILAIHNYFNIRKDREEYDRMRIIAYVFTLALMVVMFFLFR